MVYFTGRLVVCVFGRFFNIWRLLDSEAFQVRIWIIEANVFFGRGFLLPIHSPPTDGAGFLAWNGVLQISDTKRVYILLWFLGLVHHSQYGFVFYKVMIEEQLVDLGTL